MVFSKGECTRTIDFSNPFFYCAKPTKSETTLQGELDNDHPTKKPLKLMRHLVGQASLPGETVLDPFVGSGTTAEACLLDRRSVQAIEMDPKFYEIARRRFEIVDRPNLISSLLDQLEQE